jgi:hypothetical protein
MIVDRTVFINPIEPEFLAFRVSSGVDTKVRFHLKAQTGAAWNEDVLAQLQLTSRTSDRTDFYSAPSIDTANGVAQAVIPAGLAVAGRQQGDAIRYRQRHHQRADPHGGGRHQPDQLRRHADRLQRGAAVHHDGTARGAA